MYKIDSLFNSCRYRIIYNYSRKSKKHFFPSDTHSSSSHIPTPFAYDDPRNPFPASVVPAIFIADIGVRRTSNKRAAFFPGGKKIDAHRNSSEKRTSGRTCDVSIGRWRRVGRAGWRGARREARTDDDDDDGEKTAELSRPHIPDDDTSRIFPVSSSKGASYGSS